MDFTEVERHNELLWDAMEPLENVENLEEVANPDSEALAAPIGQPGWWRKLMFWRRSPPTLLELARKAFEERSYPVALAHYETALERQPGSVEARRGISLVLLHMGGRENLQAALIHIQVALGVSPYRSGLHRVKAAIYGSSGMIERAKLEKHNAAVIAGLSAHPDDAMLQNQAGIVMQGLRLHELAVEHFRAAIRLVPTHDAFVRNLAIVLYKRALAEPDEATRSVLLAGALSEALHALELNRTPATLMLIAMIYRDSGAFDRALKMVEDVEHLDPKYPGMRRLKAEIVAEIEDAARYAVGDVADPAVERLRAARNRTAKLDVEQAL